MRVKRFIGRVNVSNSLMGDDPELARAFAHVRVAGQLDRPLRGPRGGTYLPFGEMTPIQERLDDEDWTRPVTQTVFWAKRYAKYVRPSGVRSGVSDQKSGGDDRIRTDA